MHPPLRRKSWSPKSICPFWLATRRGQPGESEYSASSGLTGSISSSWPLRPEEWTTLTGDFFSSQKVESLGRGHEIEGKGVSSQKKSHIYIFFLFTISFQLQLFPLCKETFPPRVKKVFPPQDLTDRRPLFHHHLPHNAFLGVLFQPAWSTLQSF